MGRERGEVFGAHLASIYINVVLMLMHVGENQRWNQVHDHRGSTAGRPASRLQIVRLIFAKQTPCSGSCEGLQYKSPSVGG
jgi:hypothetical protein